jgi:hypothetical protein
MLKHIIWDSNLICCDKTENVSKHKSNMNFLIPQVWVYLKHKLLLKLLNVIIISVKNFSLIFEARLAFMQSAKQRVSSVIDIIWLILKVSLGPNVITLSTVFCSCILFLISLYIFVKYFGNWANTDPNYPPGICRFPNDPCVGTNSRNGTCFTT